MIQCGIILASRAVRQEPNSSNPSGDSKPILLAAGALLGILLAGSGLFSPSGTELPASALASVDGKLISKAEYLELLASMNADKRGPITSGDRHRLLSRLIEEKLLIDRGVEIGLPWSDPATSRAIVDAMINIALREASGRQPDEASLLAFFNDNHNYFTRPAQAHVRRMVFRGSNTVERAEKALRRLESEPWPRVATELADRDSAAPPDAWVSANRLPGLLGQNQADAVLALTPGRWSEPLSSRWGVDILWLVDRVPMTTPGYGEIREHVLHEYQRRASDTALRAYLDQLPGAARVEIDQDFLDELDRGDAQAP